MEKRRVGKTDLEISVIGAGCMPMGGYYGETDDEESLRIIDRACELGINFFDNAPGYGAGHAEEVLGKGLLGRRADMVVSTKIPPNMLTPEKIRGSLVESLRRLQTDYVDICYIHWPNRKEPISRTMEILESFRREGLIRAIGVSNFTLEMIQQASKYGTVDVTQPPYNFLWRFIEEDLLPYCREQQVAVTTYCSLAQGMLNGTLTLNTGFRDGDFRLKNILWQSENYGKCLYTIERLRPIAKELGVSIPQLALRWLVLQPGITCALQGTQACDEVTENAGAVGWELPAATFGAVQEISDDLYLSMPYYYDMWGNWRTWNRRGPQREV